MVKQIILGVLLVFTSLCIIGIVLLQRPKSEGGNIMSGSVMKEMVGAPQISGMLYKITYALFAMLVLLTFLFSGALASHYNEAGSLGV